MPKNLFRFTEKSAEIPFSQEELDVIYPFRGKFKDLLESEPLYYEVLDLHLNTQDEADEHPIERDGIRFYFVGRNASHEFYAGAKDGKRFKLAFGPSDENPDESTESIHETKDGTWGYTGHL